jgi:NTP pyrophosphatase (non-canonical NTP hydrolase)
MIKDFESYVETQWRQPEEVGASSPAGVDLANMTFIYTCMAGECGEVGDALKKYARGKRNLEDLALEIGDTLHYLVKLSNYIGYPIEKIIKMNMEKLNERFKKNPEWLTERGVAA